MKIIPIALACANIGTCWAQFNVQVHAAGPLPGGPFNDKVVTGNPFVAEAEMETNQTLANGTHITNKQTITVARDSQGRTRREENLPSPPGDAQQVKTVFISDPVAQVNYVLGPDNIAHKFPFVKLARQPGAASISTTQSAAPQRNLQVQRFSAAGAPAAEGRLSVNVSLKDEPGESTIDPLGTQTISGVQADGNRTTVTIPAGKIGNDAPLVITDEHWYSQGLQAMLISKQTDPRFGESSYRLTNIQWTEPPASLFQVPSNYTIEEPR